MKKYVGFATAVSFLILVTVTGIMSASSVSYSTDAPGSEQINNGSIQRSLEPIEIDDQAGSNEKGGPLTTEDEQSKQRDELTSLKEENFEYRMRERTDEHLLGRLTLIGGIIIAVSVLGGFLGWEAAKSSIGESVEASIRQELQRDTDRLRSEIVRNLDEFDAQSRRLKSEFEVNSELNKQLTENANRASSELEKLEQRNAKFESRIEKAQSDAEEALARLNAILRNAEKVSSGEPTFYWLDSVPVELGYHSEMLLPLMVYGTNLGTEKGSIRIVGFEGQMAWGIEPTNLRDDEIIELRPNEITDWDDVSIGIHLSSETERMLRSKANEVAESRLSNMEADSLVGIAPILEVQTPQGGIIKASMHRAN